MIALDDTWRAFDGVHGGLVVAWLLEEAVAGSGHQPVSITTHFVSLIRPEPAKFDVTVERAGRTTSSVRVSLEQERVRAHGLVQLGALTEDRLWSTPVDFGHLARPEDLDRFQPPVSFVPFSTHIDIRPISADLPAAGGPLPFLFNGAFGAALLLTILWRQQGWGFSVLQTGFAITTGPVVVPVASILATKLFGHLHPSRLIAAAASHSP